MTQIKTEASVVAKAISSLSQFCEGRGQLGWVHRLDEHITRLESELSEVKALARKQDRELRAVESGYSIGDAVLLVETTSDLDDVAFEAYINPPVTK